MAASDSCDHEFQNEYVVCNEEEVEIRAKLLCADDVQRWLHSYAEMSSTHWIVRKTYPQIKRLDFRKDYVCHHAGFRKEISVGGCNRRGKSKNWQCPAKMSIFILPKTSQDTYVKRGLSGKVTISGRHNHSTSNAAALALLPACDSLRSVFEGYFADGQGISEAARFHMEKMELAECTEVDLADASKNPTYRTIQHWYTRWRSVHQGPRTGDGVIDTLHGKLQTQEPLFYQPFAEGYEPSPSTLASSAERSESAPQTPEPQDQQTSDELPPAVNLAPDAEDSSSLMMSALDVIKGLQDQFGSSTDGWTRLLTRLGNVHTRTQFDTFLHSWGSAVPLRHVRRSSIRVQPTSVAHRRPGVTRGSKRLASGRPLTNDPLRRKPKRPRNLSNNVQHNQPNAKSHGDGH